MDEDSSPGLEDLPDLVMDKLIGFLDFGTRRTCRLVSQKMKDDVETIGLSVKIDSRSLECSDFCKVVNVIEANLLNLKNYMHLNQWQLLKWQTCILSGPLNSNWLGNRLQRKCTNLRILIVRDDCLSSSELYYAQFQLFEDSPLPEFKHLIEFRILASTGTRTMDWGLIVENVAYFLKTIRSRVLKIFQGFAAMNFNHQLTSTFDPSNPSKRQMCPDPLIAFIQYHRMTLETLLIVSITYVNEFRSRRVSEPSNILQFPVNLKRLLLNYPLGPLRNILEGQTKLQELYIHDMAVRDDYLPWLKHVILKNYKTLTYIRLGFSNVLNNTFSIDMAILQYCTLLETVAIEGPTTTTIRIQNLNTLPRTRLKSLKLTAVEIGPEFDGVLFMDGFNPRHFLLSEVSSEGFFKDPEYTLKFVQLVLRCRDLDTFNITMYLGSVQSEDMKAIVIDTKVDHWLGNLSAENHRLKKLSFSVKEDRLIPPSGWDTKSDGYAVAEGAGYLDYMELTTRPEITGLREQPFRIPTNLESYTIWKNRKTGACRIQPLSYTMGISTNDILCQVWIEVTATKEDVAGNTAFLYAFAVPVAELNNIH